MLPTTAESLETAERDLKTYSNLYQEEKKRAGDLSIEVTRLTAENEVLVTEKNNLLLQIDDLQDEIDGLEDDLAACNGTV